MHVLKEKHSETPRAVSGECSERRCSVHPGSPDGNAKERGVLQLLSSCNLFQSGQEISLTAQQTGFSYIQAQKSVPHMQSC